MSDDGSEWTDEQSAAYARASMGSPTHVSVERVRVLADEWDAIEIEDEWHAADLWADASKQLRALIRDLPETSED